MASEANKICVKGNKHMDTRVIKVAGIKSEVKLDLWRSNWTAGAVWRVAKPLKPPKSEINFFIAIVGRSL